MQRTLFLSVVLAATALAPMASAQEAPDPDRTAGALEDRLRTLQRGARELGAGVGESYRRLAAIRMDLFEQVDGARLTITQHNGVGPFYRLVEATYAIDGESVFHRRDESGALGRGAALEVHDGVLSPGDHTLSVVLRYVGDGREVVRYLEGYRFTVRSSHAFVAPPGQHTRLEIRAFERSVDVPYEHRLGIGYDRVILPWRD